MTNNSVCKVLVIGAGPSGSIAGALLQNKGYQVTILERQQFPRFSIGKVYCLNAWSLSNRQA